jgi:sugar (pentulose or hexulose) kinase
MVNQAYLLAHNTGTGGDKSVLTDQHVRALHAAYQPYRVHCPQAEWAELVPEELWSAVAAITRRVLDESGIDPGRILGAGISAQMFNLLPVDETLRARDADVELARPA